MEHQDLAAAALRLAPFSGWGSACEVELVDFAPDDIRIALADHREVEAAVRALIQESGADMAAVDLLRRTAADVGRQQAAIADGRARARFEAERGEKLSRAVVRTDKVLARLAAGAPVEVADCVEADVLTVLAWRIGRLKAALGEAQGRTT